MGNLEKIEKYWDTRSEGFSKEFVMNLKPIMKNGAKNLIFI